MVSAPWTHDGQGYRCTLHKKSFVPPASCPSCVDDRGKPLDVELEAPLADPPAGCHSTERHERELTAIATFAAKASRAIAKTGKSSKTANAAVKWMEIAVKALRAASAAAARREDEEIVRRRERRQRERERGAPN